MGRYIFKESLVKLTFIIFIFIFSGFNNASTMPDFPFVTVTGKSVIKVEPDMATLEFYVVTFNKEATLAKSLLNKTSNDVVIILKSNGILETEIKSFEINKQAMRASDDEYNDLAILGYEFIQKFKVTINDLKIYSKLTNELMDINNVEDIESYFDFSKKDEIEVELIKEASKKAKQKAENMALGLGVKIDSVFAFNDSGSFSSFFATFGFRSEYRGASIALLAPGSSNPNSSNIFIPHYIEISKSINVVYKIKN
jgi:uncharacterized protein YggE